MTIFAVDEMWSRKTSSDESQDRQTFTATYATAYQVQHSVDATEDEIRFAPGIPQTGDVYPGTSNVYCVSRNVSKVGLILSIVDVRYEGQVGRRQGDDPLNQEPEISYYSVTTREPKDTDGYGQPITNVNGEVLEGFQANVNDMVLEVTRNFRTVSGRTALQYLNSVNSDTFTVFGDNWEPGTGALQDFRISPITKNGVPEYFRVSAKILFRQAYNTVAERAWWYRYRNEGMYERVGTKVTIASGGGASGAAAYALTNPAGAIALIVLTNRGRGYVTAPTVTITSDTGGTGAAATAVVDSTLGQVTAINVTSGGSGYNSKLVRATDDNKEPVTKPILLKVDGTRETDSSSAVWLERPEKSFYLPYTQLGLI